MKNGYCPQGLEKEKMAKKNIVAETSAEEKFDYAKAVAELEKITAEVEDPATGIGDIDKYIRRADELIAGCRKYLRTAREKTDSMETI